ncbi:MAG TPA: ABC transporter permease [Pyrinomonadaceae bacterium]|nr:ABC transporter permease [Pyrinomonadaceae bacterium]
MLQSIISIALLHVKLILSDRKVFFFSLVMPIIFTAVMARANLTGFGSAAVANSQIEVVAADRGALGRSLVANLQAGNHWKINETSREEALERVNDGRSVGALIIPSDFTEAVFDGRPASLELRVGASAAGQVRRAEQFVSEAADKVIVSAICAEISDRLAWRLEGNGSGLSRSERLRAYVEESFAQASMALEGAAPVVMRFEPAINAVAEGEDSGVNQSSPGVIVMFALLFAAVGANVLVYERRIGVLRRLLVTPSGKATILLGKLVGIYLIGIAQISLMILAGALLFGVSWGSSPGALTLIVLSFVLVATSMGLLLATVVKTVAEADSLGSLVVMAMSALGGAWWSLSVTPQWMRLLGHLFPTAWAMDGFKDIIIGRQSAAGILPEFGALLGFAAFFLTMGLLRFRYQ